MRVWFPSFPRTKFVQHLSLRVTFEWVWLWKPNILPYIEGHVANDIIKATDLGYVTSSKCCSFLCYEVLLHLLLHLRLAFLLRLRLKNITFTVSFLLHLLAIVITFTVVITFAGVITLTGDTTALCWRVIPFYLKWYWNWSYETVMEL